ncbi:unnamed protein product [Ectocarpus sp. 4 AP-2014]
MACFSSVLVSTVRSLSSTDPRTLPSMRLNFFFHFSSRSSFSLPQQLPVPTSLGISLPPFPLLLSQDKEHALHPLLRGPDGISDREGKQSLETVGRFALLHSRHAVGESVDSQPHLLDPVVDSHAPGVDRVSAHGL